MNCKKIVKVVHHSVIYVVQLLQCCPRRRRHLDLVDLSIYSVFLLQISGAAAAAAAVVGVPEADLSFEAPFVMIIYVMWKYFLSTNSARPGRPKSRQGLLALGRYFRFRFRFRSDNNKIVISPIIFLPVCPGLSTCRQLL